MLLLIDNYDSFTWNLYQYLSELGADVEVARNDEVTASECLAMAPERIVVSPGPCTPSEAGVSVELIREAAGEVPLLGVCLGHQSIGAAFGARVESAGEIMHGKLLDDLARRARRVRGPAGAVRGDSLIIRSPSRRTRCPNELEVTARAESGVIMGVAPQDARRRGRPVPPGVDHDHHRPRPPPQLPRDRVAD